MLKNKFVRKVILCLLLLGIFYKIGGNVGLLIVIILMYLTL